MVKIYKTAFMEKILTVFWKLNTKKGLNFHWNEVKVPHVAQKDYFQ